MAQNDLAMARPSRVFKDPGTPLGYQPEIEDVIGKEAVKPKAKLRVRASIRVVSDNWVEIELEMRINKDAGWLPLTNPDRPLMVARQFSGKDGNREAKELYAVSTLRKVLQAHGATVLELFGSEMFTGTMNTTSYRYWANLGSRLSVAVETQSDGTVRVLGLD